MRYPEIVVLRASAGSGKTEALSRRYVQFLLDPSIPKNDLKNLLAMTFSNNASKEMRERILRILKGLHFGERGLIEYFSEITSLSEDQLREIAESKLKEILDNYSDFQVRTIDSFLLMIFRAECFNLNLSPDTEFSFAEREFMRYALRRFLDDAISSEERRDLIEKTLDTLLDGRERYIFDPEYLLLTEFRNLYRISCEKLGDICEPLPSESLKDLEHTILDEISEFLKIVKDSELEFKKNLKAYEVLEEILKTGDLRKVFSLPNDLPVTKPKERGKIGAYAHAKERWDRICESISHYASNFSRLFYKPYVSLFKGFKNLLDNIKISEERLFIGDALRKLCESIKREIVPDVYLRLGERIYHFFIDEFQDTSQIQWSILLPLIENSLSIGGSLFVVGDTKQFIYEFRGGDFRIMRDLENKKFFPYYGEVLKVEKLSENRRSGREICRFVETVFSEAKKVDQSLTEALLLTGLDDVHQDVRRDLDGYVEVERVGSDEELMEFLRSRIDDIKRRGYLLSDIAILARTNDQVLNIASLLQKIGVQFVSLSSLDVRKKKITGEIISLLKFLKNPRDDFSFSTFLLGDIIRERTKRDRLLFDCESFLIKNRPFSLRPLYSYFRDSHKDIWIKYFEDLLSYVGFLPLYDLISLIIGKFDLFNLFPQEEASLNKILEIASHFEFRYSSDVSDFLDFFLSSETEAEIFEIPIPSGKDAVNLMTVHKAKGLGFPVVFVFLSKVEISRLLGPQSFMEIGNALFPLRLTKEIWKKNTELQSIRSDLEDQKRAEILNLLYVSLTRSEDELYVICFGEEVDKFPLKLFAEHFGKAYGKKGFKERSPSYLGCVLKAKYDSGKYEIRKDFSFIFPEKLRYGELVHQILASIEYLEEEESSYLEKIIIEESGRIGYGYPEGIISDLKSLFEDETVRSFFSRRTGRSVRTELEIADTCGSLHRIDRVVFDTESVKIIEFKTGRAEKDHLSQVELYRSLLKPLVSKEVEGYLVYIEDRKVIKV